MEPAGGAHRAAGRERSRSCAPCGGPAAPPSRARTTASPTWSAHRPRSPRAVRRWSSAAAAGASWSWPGVTPTSSASCPSLAAGYIGPEVAAEAVAEKYADRVRWALDAGGERAGEVELQCWTVAVQVVPNADEVVASLAPAVRPDPGPAARCAGRTHRLGPRDHRHLAAAARGVRLQLHRRARGRDGRAGAGAGRTCRDLSDRPASGSWGARSTPRTSGTSPRPGP